MFLLKIYKNINAKEYLVAGSDPKGKKLNIFVNNLKNVFNFRTLSTLKAMVA